MEDTAEVKDIKAVVEHTKALAIIFTDFADRSREEINAKLLEISELKVAVDTAIQVFKDFLQKSISAHTETSIKAESGLFAIKEFVREPTAMPVDFAGKLLVAEAKIVMWRPMLGRRTSFRIGITATTPS